MKAPTHLCASWLCPYIYMYMCLCLYIYMYTYLSIYTGVWSQRYAEVWIGAGEIGAVPGPAPAVAAARQEDAVLHDCTPQKDLFRQDEGCWWVN